MRLRRKPWIDTAIHDYDEYVYVEPPLQHKGEWRAQYGVEKKAFHVELGTGKGNFIKGMAEHHPNTYFLGLEVQIGVLYYAAQKLYEAALHNAKVALFDIANIEDLFAPHEVDRFYINFCDPWPKARHAKRRLTYRDFLRRYENLLGDNGEIHFKTDNEGLFLFSLEEFKEEGWMLKSVSYDLHGDLASGKVVLDGPNAMTEYEAKFSAKGQPIFRLEAVKPVRTEEVTEQYEGK